MDTTCLSIFFLLLLLAPVIPLANGQPLVPALFTFGDSVLDVGINNHLETLTKANFLPYGRDFITHEPTGRFCNGKLTSDFTGTLYLETHSLMFIHHQSMILISFVAFWIADYLGFTSYPKAYLGEAGEKNLLIGASFASAASGYLDTTAELYVILYLNLSLLGTALK